MRCKTVRLVGFIYLEGYDFMGPRSLSFVVHMVSWDRPAVAGPEGGGRQMNISTGKTSGGPQKGELIWGVSTAETVDGRNPKQPPGMYKTL